MENFNNEIFGFGKEVDEEVEKSSPGFNYNDISGLGQSDYENEDLFRVDNPFGDSAEDTNNDNIITNIIEENTMENNNTDITYSTIDNSFENQDIPTIENYVEPEPVVEENNSQNYNISQTEDEITPKFEEYNVETSESEKVEFPAFPENQVDFYEPFTLGVGSNPVEFEEQTESEEPSVEVEPQTEEEPVLEEAKIDSFEPFAEEDEIVPVLEKTDIENPDVETATEEEPKIELSETPIEELNKLTEYKEEKIESTDINSIFDRLSVNVKDASDIFKRNTEMKNKIDTRFEELKKLQSEVETAKKNQIDEINRYKEEVLNKLTEKKEEIEKRLNILKDLQASFEKDKLSFEQYRREEKEKIEQVQKEVQAAYDERREELNHIEDVLRKQKDALDEERSELALDKIQYESDKNDLANNLLKFNELVNSFTNGVSDIKE